MPALSSKDFTTLVLDWYALDGKPRSTAKLDGASSVEIDGKTFILVHKFCDKSKYPNVLGFYSARDKGTLHCRHFYRSNSESVWRVGTGFRDKGAWVKGAEGHDKAMAGGYIFEGQVHHELDKALQEMVFNLTTVDGDAFSLYEVASSHADLRRYMVGRSRIIDTYANERVMKRVLPAPYHGVEFYDDSQVTFQTSVKTKTQKVSSSGLAATLKKTDGLWSFLNKCLSNPMGCYEFTHTALNEHCTVYRYKLATTEGDACIEIAHSESKPRTFKTNAGSQCDVTSPICWVKSVYFLGSVSTFGNYAAYPHDLCFVVQKPVDYLQQTSPEVRKRMGVEVRTQEIAGEKQTQIRGDLRKKNIIENSPYLMLALYDEKYSPLIQAFKKARKFAFYKWRSQKFQNEAIASALKAIRHDFKHLRASVLAACDDYLAMPNTSEHNQRGKDRVIAFRQVVDGAVSYDDLDRAIYRLFAENKVGTTSFYFNRIRTKEQSFFGFFCRDILNHFFELDLMCSQAISSDDSVRDVLLSKVGELLAQHRRGQATSSHALERFALVAMQHNLISEGQRLQDPQRQTLLDAIKDIGG